MERNQVVNPDLYSKEYFLTDNEGCREYLSGLNENIHPKFEKALKLAGPSRGETVLDIGCGRGELVYYCAKIGARALGIDYSKAAIEIANETIQSLPSNLRHLVRVDLGDILTYDFKEKYDIVFMIEIVEHLHDWQLSEAFKKIYDILVDDGKLIIMTPNYYYEKYLSPIKRILNLPLNLIKWFFRILKGKYKKKEIIIGLRKVFKIRADRGELNRTMHVNIFYPGKIKKLLYNFDFDIKIWCEDHSRNLFSLITKKWWGREIIAVVKRKQGA